MKNFSQHGSLLNYLFKKNFFFAFFSIFNKMTINQMKPTLFGLQNIIFQWNQIWNQIANHFRSSKVTFLFGPKEYSTIEQNKMMNNFHFVELFGWRKNWDWSLRKQLFIMKCTESHVERVLFFKHSIVQVRMK